MGKKNQYVIPLGNGWAIKGEGNKKFTLITETQKEAITVARAIARQQQSDLVIYGKDGKIRERDSYKVAVLQ
jgi:hypothetical protein